MSYAAFRDRTPSDAPRFRRPKLVIRQAPAAVPVDLAAWQRGRDLANARADLEEGLTAYATACRDLAEANRRMSPKHRGAGMWSLTLRRAWVAAAFRAINTSRAKIRAARKALAALEAA